MQKQDGGASTLPPAVESMTGGIVAAQACLEENPTARHRHRHHVGQRVRLQEERAELDDHRAADTSATPSSAIMVPSIVATGVGAAPLSA